MFPNLLGQKAVRHMSNDDMAAVIGVSRNSYESKVVSGKFTAVECKKFCTHFDKSFEYLFATDDECGA